MSETPTAPSPWRRTVVALAVLLAVAAAIAGLYHLLSRPALDRVQGEIDATEVRVTAKVPGRVLEMRVREGQHVSAGELVARLATPELGAKRDQAEAARRAAEAQSRKAESGARREEIRAAEALWQRATRAEELTRLTFERLDRLQRDAVVPTQRRDEAEAAWKAAADAVAAARASYDLALAGARREDRQAAAALVEQAGGVVAEVASYEREGELTAPRSGEIAVVVVQPGELVGPGAPVATLIDLDDVWATFNLREDRLAALPMGRRFAATIPALGGREIELEVDFVAPQGSFANWRATGESGAFDLKGFEVRARPTAPVEGLRPGMSVLVDWSRLTAAPAP
ncbi:MAG: efflux RND transporter periplasmic adaptor subunit [Holophagales bacterium]|nr:MAG: efflux RND transporter periplasmic adaptor subunit [Holophagales bacterium]